MKHFLLKHPIITASIMSVLITIGMIVLSFVQGHHYYYRIYNDGCKISDVNVKQLSDTGDSINLVKVSGILHNDGKNGEPYVKDGFR